jgi:hypothetical protein
MKYTKDDLPKMSIAEINEALHKILGRWIDGDGHITWMLGDDIIAQTEGGYAGKVNYCTNWNDLMPLSVEHGIITLKQWRNWCAICVKDTDVDWALEFDIYAEGDSPQRAIACCLILVLQERQQ